ncbi:nitrilase-related carbon-nitrogen hydrolase [Deinococcus sp. AJ005]|uniref:nitrilase-related carbon-nitrogen hydrolase n=1 Tax=Deinococcus sp. AJ005 TaxID=2652443 RepID=UPI00125CBC76|nr:nitrilase-related carbon-nitrogen hydrolase [Deinococcus sp. AJ005]QFP75733.1 carbon-nitrogen hydrolase family protein [Deinococcus sp. AJ005]
MTAPQTDQKAGPLRRFRAIAVQPKWSAENFVSDGAFRSWLRGQLQAAQPHFSPDRPNLVVLTELNGLPLVLRGAGWALALKTFERVALALFLARLPRALPVMVREKVSPIRALQLAASPDNARLYLHTCRDLAREYGVYLCCGSVPMPRYSLVNGQPVREAATLTNQTVLLAPDGTLIGVTDKVHLTPAEEAGGVDLTPGRLGEMRVFPTPVGDLGVAISLDAFRADVIGRLEAGGCTVLLQPDANGAAWTSLEGLPPDPDNVRDQPVAWLESSWTATTSGRSIRYAVNPMVVGNLLDLSFDGQSAITGRAADAPRLRSYVMTELRPGFLALTPWVADGPHAELRAVGQQLAAHSGHPREDAYRTDVLHADLELPASTLTPPPRTPHEQALEVILMQADRPRRVSSVGVWLLAGLGLIAAVSALRHRR